MDATTKNTEEYGSGSVDKERRQGPIRSRFFKLFKKTTVISICLSNLAVNFALLFDLLDYLNLVNLQSAASGIVVSLSLITIIFKLIGLFAVIKEEFAFSLIFGLLTAICALVGTVLYLAVYDGVFEGLFAAVLLSNLVTIVLTVFFSFLIKFANNKYKSSVSPMPLPVP